MKAILTVLLLFTCLSLVGQPIVSSKADFEKSGKSEIYLEKSYTPVNSTEYGIPNTVRKRFDGIYDKIIDQEKIGPLQISTTVCFNKEGKPDYWIFKMSTYPDLLIDGKPQKINMDSLSKVLYSALPDEISGIIAKRYMGRKEMISYSTFLMPSDENRVSQKNKNSFFLWKQGVAKAVQSDSSITGMEAAIACETPNKIKNLTLRAHSLETIPDIIYKFPNLKYLDLQDNDIEVANIDFARLSKLENVNLTQNCIRNDGIKFASNKVLKMLNLQNNLITTVPKGLKNNKKLESLWLGRNRIEKLANRSFRNIKQLKDINFYKCDLASIPNGIKKMKNLEVLDLYYNQLRGLPTKITKLKNLTHLALSHNELSDIPEGVGTLKKLVAFHAHHNNLSKLPNSLSNLTELTVLNLGYNDLKAFTVDLSHMPNLQELDLSANQLAEFPANLVNVPKLEKVFLRGNPFLSKEALANESRYANQLKDLKTKNIEVFY